MSDATGGSAGRGIGRHLAAVGVFVVASVVMTWPLVTRIDDTLLTWGDPVFQTWTIAWNWHALTTDPRGIFDANVFYPWRNTLAYSDHLFGQTLTVLPVIAFTGNAILADNVAVLLAFFLSSLAMYLLVYGLTGNRLAGILAGLAYAYAPSRMAHLEHLHLLSAQWAPLALWCLHRVAYPTPPAPLPYTERGGTAAADVGGTQPRAYPTASASTAIGDTQPARIQAPPSPPRGGGPGGWGWYLALAAVVFLQGLSGVYFFYFTLVMLAIAGGVYVAFAVVQRDRGAVQRVLGAAGACAVAGALLVPTLLPYQRVHDDLGVERTEAEVTFWSASWRDYLAVAPSNRAWNETFGENHRHVEQDLFPGLLALCLAGIGLTHRRMGRVRWVLLAVALGSALLSFGLTLSVAGVEAPGPYRVLYDLVPGFRAIRVPARLGLLALVGVAALAGLGVDRLWRLGRDELPYFRWYPNWLARSPRLAAMLAFGVALPWLGVESLTRIELPDPLPTSDPPPAYAWIRDHPEPTLELPMGEGPVASAWPNFWSTLHWNDVVNGYSGIVPPTYYPFRERMRDFPSDDTLLLLQGIGVETIVIHADFPDRSRAEVEAAIARQEELTLELAGPDAVYHLRRDPWMWELAEEVPAGETVDLPNAAADPVAFGLLLAILQRTGHEVTGRGTVDYYAFREADEPGCYAVLLEGDRPLTFGYDDSPVVARAGNMVLYQRRGCD